MTPWIVPPHTGAAIETRYAGCRFRSRLEARWAVFLDRLGEQWWYEFEVYDVDGRWYLPDFLLPDRDAFLEVKGPFPAAPTIVRLAQFAANLEAGLVPEAHRLILAVGDIPRPVERTGGRLGVFELPSGGFRECALGELFPQPGAALDVALTFARSIRFEEVN